jgi:branched-chain amino acid transport system permease protein
VRTVGFAFLFQQAALDIWGGNNLDIAPPDALTQSVNVVGSLTGAAIGSVDAGLADNFGKALFPEISYFTLYAPLVLILAVKPTGRFGRRPWYP